MKRTLWTSVLAIAISFALVAPGALAQSFLSKKVVKIGELTDIKEVDA